MGFLIFIVLIGGIILLFRYVKQIQAERKLVFQESDYVKEVFKVIEFLTSTGVSIHYVRLYPKYVLIRIDSSNNGLEYFGVYIKTYLEGRDDHRPELAKGHYTVFMESLATFLGGQDEAERFQSLGLDVDLIDGDDDRPAIKKWEYMPNYQNDNKNYCDALKEKYCNKYGKEISIY